MIPHEFYWLTAFTGLAALTLTPVIIASARRVDGLHIVIGLSALGLVSLLLLPMAWWTALRLPRRRAAVSGRRHGLPGSVVDQ